MPAKLKLKVFMDDDIMLRCVHNKEYTIKKSLYLLSSCTTGWRRVQNFRVFCLAVACGFWPHRSVWGLHDTSVDV